MARSKDTLTIACSLLLLLATRAAAEDEVNLRAAARSQATSNVLVDGSAEPDVVLRPGLDLDYSFASAWTLGYSGQLNSFMRHPELLSHHHELFLFVNPAWGQEAENELVLEASLQTLRNDAEFAGINLVRPGLLGKLALEPTHWLRLQGQAEVSYRWFYDDPSTSSVDALGEGRIAFTVPSRTTVSPRAGYGARRFVKRTGALSDDLDQQLDLGVRLGQGLWARAGLQLDYSYRVAIGPSGLLQRKVTQEAFQFLGEDFLFGGHRGHAALKQLVGSGGSLRAAVVLEERAYAGWPAISETGTELGEDRRDVRLMPSLAVAYAWEPAPKSWLRAAQVEFEFLHVRQYSNSPWYDTTVDVGGIDLRLEW